MKILSGNTHRELAQSLATLAEIDYAETVVGTFRDGESRVQILSEIYQQNTLILQSTSKPANNCLIELLLLADAVKRAGCKNLIAIMPYFGYSRQDRKTSNCCSVSAHLITNMIELSGINELITIDLHSKQTERFFNIPVRNLDSLNLFTPFIDTTKNICIVSPDAGGIKRVRKISRYLDVSMAIINKSRNEFDQCQMFEIIGNVKDKHCILVDDIVDTGKTICKAAELLIRQGALSVDAFVTHAVLSGVAKELIQKSFINKIYITDTIQTFWLPNKFQIISIKELLLDVIKNLKYIELKNSLAII